MLAAESLKLNNQARFIIEKIEGKIVVGKHNVNNTVVLCSAIELTVFHQYFSLYCVFFLENKRKVEVVRELIRAGYDPDPVKAWKDKQSKLDVNDVSIHLRVHLQYTSHFSTTCSSTIHVS